MKELSDPIKVIYQVAITRVIINRLITNFLNLTIYLLTGLAVCKILGFTEIILSNPLFISTVIIASLSITAFLSFRKKPNKKQVLASVDHYFNTKGALSILIDSQIELEKNVFLTLLQKCQHIKPLSLFKKFSVRFNRWHLIGATICLNAVLFIAIPANANVSPNINAIRPFSEQDLISQDKPAEEILSIIESNDKSESSPAEAIKPVKKPEINNNRELTTNQIPSQKPENFNTDEQKNETELLDNQNTLTKENTSSSAGAGSDETKESKTTIIELVETDEDKKINIEIDLPDVTNGVGEKTNGDDMAKNRLQMNTTRLDFNLKTYQSSEDWRKLKPKYRRIIELYFDRNNAQ